MSGRTTTHFRREGDDGRTGGRTDGQSERHKDQAEWRERESPAPFEMRINLNGSKAFYDPPRPFLCSL